VVENADDRVAAGPLNEAEREVAGLYEEHAGKLLSYAGSLTRDRDIALDAVQEVFLRYFVERRYGNCIENPRAWLYRVLHNYLLDRLSTAAMKCEVSSDNADGLPDAAGDPETRMQTTQAARDIASRLTPREFECLRLRTEGFSYEEIAAVLGVRPGTVSALLPRAYSKLRKAVGEGVFVPPGTGAALCSLPDGA
jgi:RNA polymerase sigma-70 factor (ECF subfamily)